VPDGVLLGTAGKKAKNTERVCGGGGGDDGAWGLQGV